jgi:hypothetical protein
MTSVGTGVVCGLEKSSTRSYWRFGKSRASVKLRPQTFWLWRAQTM